MKRPLLLAIVLASLSCALGCRGRSAGAGESAVDRGRESRAEAALVENRRARQIVCADVGDSSCLAACPELLAPPEHADCLLRLRLAADPLALALARALYTKASTLVGPDIRGSVDGYRGGDDIDLIPAWPIGEERRHLKWLDESLDAFDTLLSALGARAARAVTFNARPRAFAFFRTATPAFPSAYYSDEAIRYNLDGLLHTNARNVRETLFHELFHMNDAQRADWSTRALAEVFESILSRCGDDHDCLAPFAPHESLAPDGTFYAFDTRTGSVREYGAELALRYFVEHETIVERSMSVDAPFKCLTPENGAAWALLADEFFGGADLTPECAVRDEKD
jgi:hypothetical protein